MRVLAFMLFVREENKIMHGQKREVNNGFATPIPFRPKSNSISNGTVKHTPPRLLYEDVCFQNDFNDLYEIFIKIWKDDSQLEDISLEFAEETRKLWFSWKQSVEKGRDLQSLVEQAMGDIIDLQKNVDKAVQMINDEKEKRKQCEQELADYKSALSKVMKQVLRENQSNPTTEIKNLLDTFHLTRNSLSLDESIIQCQRFSSGSSTDSSYIRFEEELDSSKYLSSGKTWKTFQSGKTTLTSTKVDFQRRCQQNGTKGKKVLKV